MLLGAPAPSPLPTIDPPKPEPYTDPLDKIPPAAQMIVPGAIVALVDRQEHPFVWWFFGTLPLCGAAARAIIKRRLF